MSARLRLQGAHSGLHVADGGKMIRVYNYVLGVEVTDRGPLGRDEIVFMSQNADDHHQVAFVTGRAEPEHSNSVHHVAFRSAGTLDDLKALKKDLEADAAVTEIMPLCHGNAWSVYFRDPEFNGVEVFLDTPWHVRQPQGEPLDFDLTNDEIVERTRAHFQSEPEFGPIDEFYKRRAEHIARR